MFYKSSSFASFNFDAVLNASIVASNGYLGIKYSVRLVLVISRNLYAFLVIMFLDINVNSCPTTPCSGVKSK